MYRKARVVVTLAKSEEEEITGGFNTEGLGSASGPLKTGEGTWTCPM